MEARRFLKFILALVFGAGYGVTVSWFVNLALVAISTSKVFSFYFGLLFIILGGGFLWRIYSSPVTAQTAHRPLLVGFALMVILSGLFCFIVEQNIFHLSVIVRIPIFLLLGVSVCFAITFFTLDILNIAIGACIGKGQHVTGIVETPLQVYTILAVSVIMGAVIGFIFGLLDVEDAASKLAAEGDDENNLDLEEKYVFPLAALLGGLAGLINQKQGQTHSYSLLPTNVYDDGI
mmetsp:Transcript_1861/g.2403  ORF Transcript_1861/g.2403 Transcript_1861/m.2403 type:complete len:234 (-) Transcript_1861:1392-2093(-)